MNFQQLLSHCHLLLLLMMTLDLLPVTWEYRGEEGKRKFHAKRYHHFYNRYKPRRYHLTLSIRNHNVTDARFFRLMGVDNTVDFFVPPGKIFTHTYEVSRKGYWTLFVEFPGDRYAKSPKKIISRDSYPHWVMEVYYYPNAVGFSEWHKWHKGHRKRRRIT